MTPSFSALEEQLFFALAPASIRTLCVAASISIRTLYDWSDADFLARSCSLPIMNAWKKHRRTCEPSKIIARCDTEGIRLLFRNDSEWPARFRHLGNQEPSVLFVRGRIPDLPYIAIIGTRKPTPYGERVTRTLVAELGSTPIGIASGLAFGTDGQAHEQALKHRIPTVAVLGSSVGDRELYPGKHRHLAKQIVESGGGVISELPPGAPMHQGVFPLRNRFIAAICHALVVIEARERSGTLITARIALELGREVLAVPGSIFSDASDGTHSLLNAGAHICRRASDIWQALAVDTPIQQQKTRADMQISQADKRLFHILDQSEDGVLIDDLANHLQEDASHLAARLGLLELQNLVRQGPSGRWIRCGLA